MPKPDRDELNYLSCTGEWSLRAEEAFEKHLERLRRKYAFEFPWYGLG